MTKYEFVRGSAVIAICLIGCSDSEPESGSTNSCKTERDCTGGMICNDGSCEVPSFSQPDTQATGGALASGTQGTQTTIGGGSSSPRDTIGSGTQPGADGTNTPATGTELRTGACATCMTQTCPLAIKRCLGDSDCATFVNCLATSQTGIDASACVSTNSTTAASALGASVTDCVVQNCDSICEGGSEPTGTGGTASAGRDGTGVGGRTTGAGGTAGVAGSRLGLGGVTVGVAGSTTGSTVGPANVKFCNNLTYQGSPVTLVLTLGAGTSQVTLSAITGQCSSAVGQVCASMPTTGSVPVVLSYGGSTIYSFTALGVAPGQEWVFEADVGTDGPTVIGKDVKPATCTNTDPFPRGPVATGGTGGTGAGGSSATTTTQLPAEYQTCVKGIAVYCACASAADSSCTSSEKDQWLSICTRSTTQGYTFMTCMGKKSPSSLSGCLSAIETCESAAGI